MITINQVKVVLYANLMVIVGLCLLLGIVLINTPFNQRQRKLFIYAIAGNLFIICCVILDYFCNNVDIPIAVITRKLTSFVNFAASPLVPILLAAVFTNRRRSPAYYVPAGLNVIICMISMFYPIVFGISEHNKYSRGSLFLFPIATALLYMILLLLEPSSKHRRSRRQERVFLIIVLLLLIGSIMLEVFLRMSLQLWVMAGLSLILYYLLLNVHFFTLDGLTGCYNRITFASTISINKARQTFIITSMDLNGLKIINDTEGHAQGDKLLIGFVDLLSEFTANCSDLYRVGGDEFVLITQQDKADKYRIGMQKMYVASKKKGISFSFGEAIYSPDQSFDNVIALADERMYKMKKEMKAEIEGSKQCCDFSPT